MGLTRNFAAGPLPKSFGKVIFVAEFTPPFNQAEKGRRRASLCAKEVCVPHFQECI
ncbi:hypothetical protein ABID20_003550 [Rhizobium alvei]